MKWSNIFLAFMILPILIVGSVTYMATVDIDTYVEKELESIEVDYTAIHQLSDTISDTSESIQGLSEEIDKTDLIVEGQKKTFERQVLQLDSLRASSDEQTTYSDDIYDKKISDILGEPIRFHESPHVQIKVYELNELGYRGYIGKVKLYNPLMFRVAFGNHTYGEMQVTSEVAEAANAMLAINGGGFGTYTDQGKTKALIIGTVVSGGKFMQPFYKNNEPLFFAGINWQGELIGAVPETVDDLIPLSPREGVSFIPVLIQDFVKQEIPGPWKNTKHPRTIMGSYANDDLIFIVIDGRQEDWSSGVTLEDLQDKLLELGVKNAYNLDGGGSSTFYYDGEVLNKPSDGQERPVATHILILP